MMRCRMSLRCGETKSGLTDDMPHSRRKPRDGAMGCARRSAGVEGYHDFVEIGRDQLVFDRLKPVPNPQHPLLIYGAPSASVTPN